MNSITTQTTFPFVRKTVKKEGRISHKGRIVDLRHIKAKTRSHIIDLRGIKYGLSSVQKTLDDTEKILAETEELLDKAERVVTRNAESVLEEGYRVLSETDRLVVLNENRDIASEVEEREEERFFEDGPDIYACESPEPESGEQQEPPVEERPFPQFYPFYTYHTDNRHKFFLPDVNVVATTIRANAMIRRARTQEQVEAVKRGYKQSCELIYNWCRYHNTPESLDSTSLWTIIALAKRIGFYLPSRCGNWRAEVVNKFVRQVRHFIREYNEVFQ